MRNLKGLLPIFVALSLATAIMAVCGPTAALSKEGFTVYSEADLTDMSIACMQEPLDSMRQKCLERVEALRVTLAGMRAEIEDAQSILDQVLVYPSVTESLTQGF
jgi:hypothetical protein